MPLYYSMLTDKGIKKSVKIMQPQPEYRNLEWNNVSTNELHLELAYTVRLIHSENGIHQSNCFITMNIS
jgi:hypothetical protein